MKLLLVTSALFTFTTFVNAQRVDDLIADFERSKKMTLAYLDAMPASQFSYKPTAGVRSFAQQMLHASQGMFGLVSNGTGTDRKYADQILENNEDLYSKEAVTRIVIESFDYSLSGLQSMDTTAWSEVVVIGPFKVSRLGWIQKALEHTSHHRGQCAVYLRLLGITPPEYQLFD